MSERRDAPSHREEARYWRHPGMPKVDLFKARFVRHSFGRHTHDAYTIGVIEDGVEEYAYRGETHRVGRGGLAMVEPNEVHTGHAGVAQGWRYRVLYPSVDVVSAAAREIGLPDTPGLTASAVDDPELARRLRAAHLAGESGDRLSASGLLHDALIELLLRYGRDGGGRGSVSPASGTVSAARDILHERLVDPPALAELAQQAGSPPYALLRAFRDALGLPPHAYLNQIRVHRARRLLAEGTAPGETAVLVGFADQAHFSRHFKRHVGVPPGAYQRGVVPS